MTQTVVPDLPVAAEQPVSQALVTLRNQFSPVEMSSWGADQYRHLARELYQRAVELGFLTRIVFVVTGPDGVRNDAGTYRWERMTHGLFIVAVYDEITGTTRVSAGERSNQTNPPPKMTVVFDNSEPGAEVCLPGLGRWIDCIDQEFQRIHAAIEHRRQLDDARIKEQWLVEITKPL